MRPSKRKKVPVPLAPRSSTARSRARLHGAAVATGIVLVLASPPAFADDLAYRFDAAAGILGLSRFSGEDAGPLALTYGASATVFFMPSFGVGGSISLSQPDSYRSPCEAGRFCLRRFQQFGGFAESRWIQRRAAVAWEPWGRLGVGAVQAASEPSASEGDPGVQWAVGINGKVGSDLRLRWLVLGIFAEAVFATGDIHRGYGMGVRVGLALGANDDRHSESP